MKIFITGATGYLGHQLALTLAQSGYTVHALVRDTASPRIPRHPNIRIFRGDITEPATLPEPMRGCERAYHVAAMVSLYSRPSTLMYKVNVDGTRNVLAAALEHHVKKLVFTSSCAVLGRSLYTPLSESDPRGIGIRQRLRIVEIHGRSPCKRVLPQGAVYRNRLPLPDIRTRHGMHSLQYQ